jgi:hypothetical protein
LAWLYTYGKFPSDHTDHIDGDVSNDRIKNLREATASENLRNQRRLNKRNTSGIKGVYWFRDRNKWVAQIGIHRKVINLGYFTNKSLAEQARIKAEIKYHGEFRGRP